MALIYIIEDDDSIREIEEFALMNAGHKVLGFTCAKDFYKKLEDVMPDLCLVDIMLPDENGNEIVRKLRKSTETAKLPVIMATAKTSELDLVKGIEDGADDYIKKPFSVMELISRVKALLRRTLTEEAKELKLDGLTINNEKHEVSVNGNLIELTYKEYELLSLDRISLAFAEVFLYAYLWFLTRLHNLFPRPDPLLYHGLTQFLYL